MTYTIEVFREGDAWIADVVGMQGGHAYARSFAALQHEIQEVIALVLDLPEDAEVQRVHYTFKNVDDVFVRAAELGDERERLEDKQRQLGIAAAHYASQLADAGYSVRDISGALKMSTGRVSQITSARQPVASK